MIQLQYFLFIIEIVSCHFRKDRIKTKGSETLIKQDNK